MPVFRGTYYTRTFAFTHDAGGAPVDISGWQFRSHWRAAREDPEPMVELSTASGGFLVTDGPGGLLEMRLREDETQALIPPKGKAYFDVLRTDDVNGDIWLFEGSVPVKDPITRDA